MAIAVPACELKCRLSLSSERVEPPATLSLVSLQPVDSAMNRRRIGGHSGTSKGEDHKSGSVAIARLKILLFSVRSLPIPQRCQRPAAVLLLQRE